MFDELTVGVLFLRLGPTRASLIQLVPTVIMSTISSAAIWTITFEDDFEGQAGDAPCLSRWGRDLGGGGFGNNELESYTDGSANSFLDGEGNLVIEARRETTTGVDGITRAYSSARLHTKHTFSQRYGRFEARMKVPEGQGIWSAFWMLGSNIDRVGWPNCGEIDILESVGPFPKTAYATIHGPGYSAGNPIQGSLTIDHPLSDDFHVYGIEWEQDQIRWYFDGENYATISRNHVGDQPWPFDHPFHLLLNLAVGGYWPGEPDSTTKFPQRLTIDYVRVFALASDETTGQR